MSDVFLLPLDRVIRSRKIIFSIKQHENMEDTSTKVSCAWDHHDKMIKFPEMKEICEEDFWRDLCYAVSMAPPLSACGRAEGE